jgi:2',3'-cyclic-nucleotide 2'-phosphodiesterase (5'-nucleotidase family)
MSITRRDFCKTALLAGAVPLGAFLTGRSPLLSMAHAAASTPLAPTVLTLLHTNDLHGHIYLPETATGLTRLASLIERVRQDMPNVLLLDAGDMIHGTPEEEAFEGKPIIQSMNALQYDVATAGNHEFDFGQRITEQALTLAKFPVLSANVLAEKTGQPWGDLKPYIIREVAGIRIAIFGLTTVDTVTIQFPRTLQGIHFADPTETARKLVPQLRQQEKADLVIFLSHLGYKEDLKMAAAVPGIDLILGGHSHTRLSKQVWVKDTLITQTGYYGRALGRTDLLIERDAEGHAKLTINGRDGHWWGQGGLPAPLDKSYPTSPLIDPTTDTAHDAKVRTVYFPFREQMDQRRAEVLTTVQETLPAADAKEKENALGNLLADAVRAKFKVDIGLVPTGAISQDLPAGPVTVAQATDTISGYTRQHVVVVRAPGKQVREMCARAIKPGQFAMQTSGIGRSERGLEVNGQPLHDETVYTVAGAAYLIQNQLMDREGVVILNDDPEAPTTREAIVEFLRGHAPITNRPEKHWAFDFGEEPAVAMLKTSVLPLEDKFFN